MSVVTGITLQFSCAEDFVEREAAPDLYPIVGEINKWLSDKGFLPLISVEMAYGGNKHPQFCVYGGGYNYFPDDEFSGLVKSVGWRCPDDVILLLKHEDDPIQIICP